ncbi:MAG: phage tail tape measure protein, partial [Clostridia bacterium]|nr:phage tail tape measure protein [Clostridia bacterium]
EDVSVAVGLMANAGVKGSQAGTALRSLMTRLSKPTKESGEAMKALGISITNADGTMKPFMQIVEGMREKFAGLGEAEKAQYAAMLAGQEGISGLLAIVNTSEADFEKLTGAISACDGAAKQMADTRMDNLAGDVKLLKSAFEGLQISVAESANGMARDVVQSVGEMLSAMNEAYASGGIDGMMAAFTKQFPKLLTKVIGVAVSAVAVRQLSGSRFWLPLFPFTSGAGHAVVRIRSYAAS